VIYGKSTRCFKTLHQSRLPPVYAERYGKVEIGDRGGMIVPGAKLNAPLEAV
jgi:hypothetical protein